MTNKSMLKSATRRGANHRARDAAMNNKSMLRLQRQRQHQRTHAAAFGPVLWSLAALVLLQRARLAANGAVAGVDLSGVWSVPGGGLAFGEVDMDMGMRAAAAGGARGGFTFSCLVGQWKSPAVPSLPCTRWPRNSTAHCTCVLDSCECTHGTRPNTSRPEHVRVSGNGTALLWPREPTPWRRYSGGLSGLWYSCGSWMPCPTDRQVYVLAHNATTSSVSAWSYVPLTGTSRWDYGAGSISLPECAVRLEFSWDNGSRTQLLTGIADSVLGMIVSGNLTGWRKRPSQTLPQPLPPSPSPPPPQQHCPTGAREPWNGGPCCNITCEAGGTNPHQKSIEGFATVAGGKGGGGSVTVPNPAGAASKDPDSATCRCGPGYERCGSLYDASRAPGYHLMDSSCAQNDPCAPFYDPLHQRYHLMYVRRNSSFPAAVSVAHARTHHHSCNN